MDKWEDSATGATAMNEARSVNAATPGAEDSATAAESGETAPRVSEWSVEVEETQAAPPTARIAAIAGAALGGLAIAGGVTWLIIQRRRINAAREMERALAASRLLRMTPIAARPHMLEAFRARESAMQLAQQSAAETARMSRALRQAASVSASNARDVATERAANAQETITGALNTARGATGAWRIVAQTAPGGFRWLGRAFTLGRYAGRVEQRLK